MAVTTDVTARLAEAIDELCEANPSVLADGETIVALHRQLERVQAITTRAIGAFDASRAWEADGACSAAAWIRTDCRLPMATAARRVRNGRRLRHMPATEEAWLAGEIGEAQVGLLAAARTPNVAEAFDRDETMLVAEAGRLHFHHFVRAMAYWRHLNDPDDEEKKARDQHDERRVHLSESLGGIWFLDGKLTPIGGEIVNSQLERIYDELFEADWAEARALLGTETTVADPARTPAQRRHDALVEMARRAGAVEPGARLPVPLFSVLVGYEPFGNVCELASGTVVTPGSLVPWLGEAEVERIVFDGPDRVINVGVRRRIFTGATRRAVQVRDRECYHEYCDLPAEDCQIDHIEPWAAGGLTTEDNGRAACGYHNRRRQRRTWPPA